MSKKYSRDQDILERLEEENRDLKSQVRSLSKQLKKLNRGYYKFLAEEDTSDQKEVLEKVIKDAEKVCYDCGGNYKLLIIVNRRFRKCQNCGKTGKVTIINGKAKKAKSTK